MCRANFVAFRFDVLPFFCIRYSESLSLQAGFARSANFCQLELGVFGQKCEQLWEFNPSLPILSLHKCLSISPCLTIQRKKLRPTHITSSNFEKWQVFSLHIDIAISPWSRRGESMKTGWTTKTVVSTSPSPSMPDLATHRCQKKPHKLSYFVKKERTGIY